MSETFHQTASSEKRKLESAIKEALKGFTEATGLIVEGIDIDVQAGSTTANYFVEASALRLL